MNTETHYSLWFFSSRMPYKLPRLFFSEWRMTSTQEVDERVDFNAVSTNI